MFAIQFDESNFGITNIFMAYVRFHGSSLSDTFDEFLFANYRETVSKGETIF